MVTAVCDQCQTSFEYVQLTRARKYCSHKCLRTAQTLKQNEKRKTEGYSYRRTVEINCAHCGTVFRGRSGIQTARFCSRTCGAQWVNIKHNRTGIGKERIRRRRERESYDGPIVRAEVFKRDGWRCHLCNKRIDPKLKYPHLKSASIDHIVPLSKGGVHGMSNVRAAHFICNSLKADRGGGEQFLLIP